MNNIQKLLLIISFASLLIFLFIGTMNGFYLSYETGRMIGDEWFAGVDKILWNKVIPLIVFLTSLFGVYLFKDKKD